MFRNWQEKARPANRVAQFLRIVAVVRHGTNTQNRWITWRVVGQPETGRGRLLQGCPSFAQNRCRAGRSLPTSRLLDTDPHVTCLDYFRIADKPAIGPQPGFLNY